MKKLLLVLLVLFFACSSSGTLIGTIYIVGNEPFTSLAIEGPDGTVYRIIATKELQERLSKLQGTKVEIEYNTLTESAMGKEITVKVVKEVK